jgi:hypothetical protein
MRVSRAECRKDGRFFNSKTAVVAAQFADFAGLKSCQRFFGAYAAGFFLRAVLKNYFFTQPLTRHTAQ